MNMRANRLSGRKLEVRWATEKWTPAITRSRDSRAGAREQIAVALSLDLPLHKRIVKKRKQPSLWLNGAPRLGKTPGLNRSRITLR